MPCLPVARIQLKIWVRAGGKKRCDAPKNLPKNYGACNTRSRKTTGGVIVSINVSIQAKEKMHHQSDGIGIYPIDIESNTSQRSGQRG